MGVVTEPFDPDKPRAALAAYDGRNIQPWRLAAALRAALAEVERLTDLAYSEDERVEHEVATLRARADTAESALAAERARIAEALAALKAPGHNPVRRVIVESILSAAPAGDAQ